MVLFCLNLFCFEDCVGRGVGEGRRGRGRRRRRRRRRRRMVGGWSEGGWYRLYRVEESRVEYIE